MLNYDNLFLKTDVHVKKTRVTKSPRKHPLALKKPKAKERRQKEKLGNTNERTIKELIKHQ